MNQFFRLICIGATAALFSAAPLNAAAVLGSQAPGADESGASAPRRYHGDRVSILHTVHVGADEAISGNVVNIMGGAVIDGEVSHDAVVIMGDVTVNGTVGHNLVVVMGDVTVNGTVHGDIVAPGGNITLGPGAIVDGKIVHIGGDSDRKRWSYRGQGGWFGGWFKVSILINAAFIGLYALVALIFPRPIRECGDRFMRRPGLAILAAFLALLCLPVLFVLLLVTIIGIPFALALPFAVIFFVMYGKASIYALIGRKISDDRLNTAVAVLVGGAVCLLICLIPIFGLLFGFLLACLGFSCAIASLLPAAAGHNAAASPPSASPPPAPPVASVEPPVISGRVSSELPRAGFWVRIGALFIDAIIIGFAFGWGSHTYHIAPGLTFSNGPVWLALAAYGALMWKFKGATVGGMIFGLHVVRLDNKPIGWETAIVRALGCFLSAAVMFLGFFWIAFDDGKQAWHDKIAGTVVVRAKGISLV